MVGSGKGGQGMVKVRVGGLIVRASFGGVEATDAYEGS